MQIARSIALLTMASIAAAAAAQDKPVMLKMSSWVPAQHPLNPALTAWAEDIRKASGGTITATLFPSEQLGKAFDHYDMARDGIADAAYVNPGYQPGRFPIFAAASLPFQFANAKGGTAAIDAWYRAYAAREMKDVQFCFAFVHDPGSFHSRKAIVSPADVKGMKVRPATSTIGQMITALGGTNVQASAPEARDMLERGVADAITFPWGSIGLFGIDKVVSHHLDAPLYVTPFVWVLNKDKYNAMSAAQKKVIDEHCTPNGPKRSRARGPTSKPPAAQSSPARRGTRWRSSRPSSSTRGARRWPRSRPRGRPTRRRRAPTRSRCSTPCARAWPSTRRRCDRMKRRFGDRVINAIEWTAAVFVGLVATDIFISVLLRKFFSTSIPDSYDFGRLLLGVLIFWGIGATSYRGTHITVDLLYANVGARYQRAIDVFATLVLLFVVAVQTFTLYDKVWTTRADNVLTFDLRLPTWPFFALAWIGDVSAVILIALRTYRLIFHPELLTRVEQIKPVE